MRNRSTTTINAKTVESIFAEIALIEKRLAALRKRVMRFLPTPYGSDVWWEREIEEGLKEVKAGKVKRFETMEETIRYLNS